MILRWEDLGNALELKGEWTDAQQALRLDLLGVHPALRDCSTHLPPDATLEYKKDVVAEKLEWLVEERDTYLHRLNVEERDDAMDGKSFDASDAAERLRRYDALNQRTFFRVLGQFIGRLRAFRKRASRLVAPASRVSNRTSTQTNRTRPNRDPARAKAPTHSFTEERLASIVESVLKTASPRPANKAPRPATVSVAPATGSRRERRAETPTLTH